MTDDAQLTGGGCLCGAVRYRVKGPLRDVVNCHCGQCRRTHGNFAAYTAAAGDDLVLIEQRGLKWFPSSDKARRGFCSECGSSLFWQRLGGDTISISAGTVDPPTGLKTIRHIFVADVGDFYEIADALEQMPGSMSG
jgi:hypothetical protein